jgi:hypothetical protein
LPDALFLREPFFLTLAFPFLVVIVCPFILLIGLVAAIALSRRHFGFSVLANVLRERSANVRNLVETSFLITSNKSFVSTSVDQFSFACFLFSHCASSFFGSVPVRKIKQVSVTYPNA